MGGDLTVLKFRGHHFFGDSHCVCCVADERMVSIDPTGTAGLRQAFNSALAIKWRGLRVLARRMIVDQDILSMGSKGLMAIANPAIQGGATRTQMFQRWFDYIAGAQVLNGDGSFIRSYIERGYAAGRTFAQGEVGLYSTPLAGDRMETIFQLAVVELQGIIEAVSQGAVRAVANGLLQAKRPAGIVRDVNAVIDRVGIPRSTALVELLVVKAFSEASLDVYESAGVRRVGLVPETLLATKDARRVTPTGPAGTRSRRGKGPSLRTIQRIAKQEREIATAAGALVRVKTAGDKKVCKVCRGIAKRGPYRINKARSLIPAHPRCRCVFVPVVVLKKPAQDEFNPNQPRDPEGKWTSGGAGTAAKPNFSGLAKLKGSSAERVEMRKALKTETDPVKRQELKQRIIDSFALQIKKKGGDAALQAKLEKFQKMYGMKASIGGVSNVQAPPPIANLSPFAPPKPPVFVPPAPPSPVIPKSFTPEEAAAYKSLSELGSTEQAKMWMKTEAIGPLSKIDRAHIRAYSGAGYRKTNAQLRKGSLDEATYRHSKDLSKALDKLPKHEAQVYRKADLTAEQFALYKAGNIVQERGFTSSSKYSGTWSGSKQYVIKSKTGRDISHVSLHPGENEVLFKPNTNFRVTKVTGNQIHMEELDDYD
jgi:hypothetical protein